MNLREKAMVLLAGLAVAAAGCSGGPAEPAMALNVRYAPDGTLVVFSGSAIDTYGPDLAPKAHIPVLSGLGPVFSVSDDGSVAAVASSVSGHQVQLFNVSSGTRGRMIDLGLSPAADSDSPQGLTLSPAGDLLFVVAGVGGQGDMSGMFDTATGARLWTIEAAYGVNAVFSPDGSTVYVSSVTVGNEIGLEGLDSRTGTSRMTTPNDQEAFGAMPSPNTLIGVTVTADPVSYLESTKINLLSTADGSLTSQISLPANTEFAGNVVKPPAFNCAPAAGLCALYVVEKDPSGNSIIANAVQIWALDGTQVQSIDNTSGDVALSSDGHYVASVWDGDVEVHEASDGSLVKVLPYLNRKP